METTVHGELDEFGCGTSWKKPPLKRKRMYTIFQNGLAFLWQMGKASLSEFSELYSETNHKFRQKSTTLEKVNFHF